MTEQVQAQQEQQITVGFAKALHQFSPDWRNALSKDEVNRYRYFYAQGVQDVALVSQMQQNALAQNLQAIRHTIATAGNEEEIARLQAEQAAAEQAAAAAALSDEAAPTPAQEEDEGVQTDAEVEVDQALNDQIQADAEAAAHAEVEVEAASAGWTDGQTAVPSDTQAEVEQQQQ